MSRYVRRKIVYTFLTRVWFQPLAAAAPGSMDWGAPVLVLSKPWDKLHGGAHRHTKSTTCRACRHWCLSWRGTCAQVTAILVLYGLPWLLTGSILAHETMHAWLRLSGVSHLPADVEEGLAQLMALLWLEHQAPDPVRSWRGQCWADPKLVNA